MRKKLVLPLLLLSLSITSCGDNPPVDKGDKVVVTISSNFASGVQYELPFYFKESEFKSPSSRFNKSIAMFAYGASIANYSKESISKFYGDLSFDNIVCSSAYDVTTIDTIAYTFAHKTILDDKDLVFLCVRGFNYAQEWCDNFNVGLTGEHNGFSSKADIVNESLKNYMSVNEYSKENTIVLISGYSRGGAVANLTAKRVIDEELVANKENIYAYTFEAPKAALEKGEYNNIYNLVSRGDMIPSFAPEAYGFTRYGVDIDIYRSSLDKDLKSFDSSLVIAPFQDDEKYHNDGELINYILSKVTTYSSDTAPLPMRTREEFVNNYQSTIQYALNLYFSLKSSTISTIVDYVKEQGMLFIAGLLADDALYNFLKPYIDQDGYPYVDEDLHFHCNNLKNMVTGPFLFVISLAATHGLDLFTRIISQHYPEVNYVLLSKYR